MGLTPSAAFVATLASLVADRLATRPPKGLGLYLVLLHGLTGTIGLAELGSSCLAAVDRHRDAGDERGVVGAQPQHARRHIGRGPDPPDRHALGGHLLGAFAG